MEVGTQAMDHLVNILQTDRYVYVISFSLRKTDPLCCCANINADLSQSSCQFIRSDSEIIGYALDTLYNIICSDEEEEQGTGCS